VIGSIQPGVLVKILEKRIENGFAHRLLFAYPDDLKVEYWTQNQLNPKIPEDWQTIVNSILDMEFGSEEGKILEFSRDAEQKMILWQRDLADMANRCSNEQICGLFPKIEQYSIRLALILQVLYYVCQEGSIRCIGIEATEGAIELAKYFINTATKVHNQCSLNNPLKKLPLDKQNVYNALPYKFSTGEALKIALSLGMSNRNLFRFIKDIKFFRLLKKGQYEKIL
jgi:hypothetical protein